jgi:hypothetical protein
VFVKKSASCDQLISLIDFTMDWCKKSELNLNVEQRFLWLGIGRLLISEDGENFDFEGSAPGVDWSHHFQLKINDLEEYWCLEVSYSKEHISKLKSILKCSTPELIKMVNKKHDKITFTEQKEWNDNFTKLEEIANDLKLSGIEHSFKIKTRKQLILN